MISLAIGQVLKHSLRVENMLSLWITYSEFIQAREIEGNQGGRVQYTNEPK
jgi:hypothetical protein